MADDNSVERRIQLINEEVERKNREAVELLEYLNVQRVAAKELEDLEEEELKRRGIIIGQHIPSLKSKLDLDHDKLSEFGDLSSTLLIARDLVEQNHTNFLRRTGNLPISDTAEAKKLKYEQSMIGVDTDSPHYLTKTHNTTVRTERVAVRFAETLHTREVERTKFLEASKSLESGDQLNSKKKFKKKIMLTAIQREENENILKGMNHKLNYLRNPRNDPKSITKMLVKPSSFFDGANNQQQPGHPHDEGHEGHPDDHSLHSDMHSDSHSKINQKGSVAGSHGHGAGGSHHQASTMEASMNSAASKAKSKFGKQHFTLDNNPLFVSEPTLVNFTNYEIGKKYTQNFSFRNVSAVTRSVRIIPPANKVFAITPLKYPTNSVAGMVAPGMCVMTTLSFNPSSLGDYSDFLRVETESGNFKVQIHAQREPPYLSIPSCLNVGNCLVGDASRVSITCLNSGGAGKFTLLTEEQYLNEKPEVNIDYGSLGCMRLPPFTFYPTEFSLVRNESTELNIEFVPLSVDTFEYPFYMKCDNGSYRKFSVRGISRDLNVTLAEINQVGFESQDSTQYSDMIFPAANIDSEQSQQVMVVNETGLAVEYEWVWMPLSVKDMHTCGQEAIRQREIASSKEHGFNMTEPDLPPPPGTGEEADGEHRLTTAEKQMFGTMVKSMQMTRDEEDGDSHVSTNRAICEQFEIHPARGVMPHDGAESFTVSFTPSELRTVSMRAVLMIKSIPKSALPGDTQQECLARLLEHGHGPFTRLKSWLEEIGTPATVEEYVKPNGDTTDSTKLISLSTIVSLIISQTINNVDPNCSIVLDEMYYARINQWIRKAIHHMYCFRKAAVLDDESSVESDDEQTAEVEEAHEAHHKHVHLEVFDWKHTMDEIPTLMYPMKVNHEFVPEPPKSAKQKQEGVIEEEEPPVGQTLHEFTNEEREQLSEIWMDVKHTLLLLGHDMCEMLNDKVKHEAIDFLKDCTLNHYCGLNFGVYGEGCRQYVQSYPPQLNIGGPLSIGKEWTGEFKLVNTSNTMAEIEIDIARSVFKKCASSLHVTSFDDLPPNATESNSDSFHDTLYSEQYSITTDVNRVLLMPMSDQTVYVTVKFNLTGKFELVLPFKPKSALTVVEPLIIVADVIGPRLKFQAFEVDMGLVGVGGEVSKTLTFTNEGDVPLMFMMRPTLHVDISAKPSKDDKSLMPNSARTLGSKEPGTGRLNSQRSVSRSNTSRSDDYSVANSEASEGSTFKIELKNAVCVIDPPSGVVGPMQPYTVNITVKAGKIGQRIRGMIETRVFDNSGKIEILSHFLNMRGEVQAPKTKMYPLNFNLGQVYIGMPVKFNVTVENICNLPTKYKLMRPGGETALYQLTFDKEKGPLGPKELVHIECTFIALTPGLIDDTIANKIFGSQVPLGFCFKAVAKGITLDFQNLLENDPLPTPLAGPEETQFPGSDKPPEPGPIVPIELGDNVELYERKWTRFVIRNLSAIPATYELKAKQFPVVEKVKKGSVASVDSSLASLNVPERTDLFLMPHETGANKFQSEAGKKYITVTLQRQEDRKFLRSGLGASYLVENANGVIPPWGVQEIIVRAFNDIPGKYNDDIECSLYEGEVVRKFNLPIKMNIVGCPVVIEKDTLGMTTVHREPATLIGKPLLQLGHACVNCDPLVREFFLRNNGSKNGKVKWNVKGLAQKTNGPIKFSYNVDANGRVKSVLRFWEDITKDSPFKVEPEAATIPPYGKIKFKVTLFRTENIGKEYAELSGKVTFSEDLLSSGLSIDDSTIVPDDVASPNHQNINGGIERKMSSASINTMRSKTSSTTNLAKPNKFTLSLILEGDFVHPTIVVDKNTLVASSQITTAPDLCGVLLKGQSTILFGRDAKPADLCYKSLTIVNPLDALLSFTLTTMGPYQLKDAVDESVVISKKDLLAVTNKQATMSTAPVQPGPGANSRIFSLLPNRSGSIVVAFNPKKDVRESLIRSFGTEAGKPTEQRGKLIFTYNTGQTLQVPIITKISTPFIGGSCPRMYFGVCHTSQTCQGLYLITNPTDVPASWTVEHVPGGGAWKKGTAIKVPGFEPKYVEVDDPSVFEISPRNGVVMGPTVSVTAAVAAPPKDFNRFEETIVPQRTVESSWATSTMSMKDSLEVKHHDQHQSEADACFPMPLTIRFVPNKNAHYSSRFRFTCEYGNSFELVLQGEGTYEEHEHKPLNPIPK